MFLDYYSILGVDPKADIKAIILAYREQAKMWHPDLNSGRDATANMQKINESYFILKNAESRRRYDAEYEAFNQKFEFTSDSNQHYEVKDDILRDWIYKARQKAVVLARETASNFVGIILSSLIAAFNKVKWLLLLYVFIQILYVIML